jgi:hypothetical protein
MAWTPASGVRSHTTARLEFDRDTYTPCTPEELPSLAVKDFMIADRSDLVAGLADELPATALAASANVSAMTASPAMKERNVTPLERNHAQWQRNRDERSLIESFPAATSAGRSRARRNRRRVQGATTATMARPGVSVVPP